MSTIPAKVLRAAAEGKDAIAAATKLEKEKAVLEERCATLEARCAELGGLRDAAEAARVEATEAFSVAQAERRLVDETISRADSLVGELRAERASLLNRATEAEADRKALQQQVAELLEKRGELQESLAIEQVERRAAALNAERLATQLDELKASSLRRNEENDTRVNSLESTRDELRAERAVLHEELSVAQAERKMLDEMAERMVAKAAVDDEQLRTQLATAEQRAEDLRASQHRLEEEHTATQSALAVAEAEKRLLQELANRMQQMQIDDRTHSAASRERHESSAAELTSRLEASDSALAACKERLGSVEAERRSLSERLTHADAQLKSLQGEHAALVTERRQLDDHVRRQESQIQSLQLERVATQSLEERFRDMQTQRDAAEAERSTVQEELAAVNARQTGLEEASRGSEAALKSVQQQLSLEQSKERERDERVKEFQRQRDSVQRERARLQEQLSVTSADARAASEREHALFIRTTVLEQQYAPRRDHHLNAQNLTPDTRVKRKRVHARRLQQATKRAIDLDGAIDDQRETPVSVEEALHRLGNVNDKWAANA